MNLKLSNHPIRSAWIAAGCLLAAALPVRGVVLDWDNYAWTTTWSGNQSFSQSFETDAQNTGNDVTLTFSGKTSRFADGTPSVDAIKAGGLGGDKSLRLEMDFAGTGTSEFVTVTIDFNYSAGVSGLSFKLFDVDNAGSFEDLINGISGNLNGGANVAATVTGGSDVTVSGSGLNVEARGSSNNPDSQGNGTVNISFGTNLINQVVFTYRPGTGGPSDPGPQGISIYDIVYQIPEVHPSLIVALGCAALLLGRFRKRPGAPREGESPPA